jgi:hypothetical protein
MITSEKRTTVTLAQLGPLKSRAVRNSRDIANQLQGAFLFDSLIEPLVFDKESYALPNRGYDLVRAARDILAGSRVPRPLIVLSSLPLSAPEEGEDSESFLFSSPLSDDPNVVIVSTHVWEKVLPGQRDLEPYLLFTLGGLALRFCSALAYHQKTRGCFFDTCHQVADIDEAFKVHALCEDCEGQLEKRLGNSDLRVEQVASAKRLLNRAFGKKVCFIAMPFKPALRPVYDAISKSLTQEE